MSQKEGQGLSWWQCLLLSPLNYFGGRTGMKDRGAERREKVRCFLAIGQGLAEEIDPFNQLGLSPNEEQRFFTERFSVYLFDAICPLTVNPREEETLNGRRNNFDGDLEFKFGKIFNLELNLEGITSGQRDCRRAIDYAARNVFSAIATGLKEENLGDTFVKNVVNLYKGKSKRLLLTALFEKRPQTKENLSWIFERDGGEIARKREEIWPNPLPFP